MRSVTTLLACLSLAAAGPLAAIDGSAGAILRHDPGGSLVAAVVPGGIALGPAAGDGSTRLPRVEVDGTVRALAWSGRDEPTLWVVRHRAAKRGLGVADLLQIDPTQRPPRARRVRRLPADTSDLVWWPYADSLVVVAGDALRTIRLAGLTSGPLYRVAGGAHAAACVGGSRFLVAGPAGLLTVDLADVPGPDGLPALESLALDPSPRTLVALDSGDAVDAVDAGGRIRRIELEPLAISTTVEGVIVSLPLRDEVAMRPSRVPAPAASDPEPEPDPVSVSVSVSEPPVARREPPPAPIDAQLSGRVVGPAAAAVEAVTLYGPDSLLREAARVRPDELGRWSVEGLAAGRYRVQLAAAAGRVVLSDPPYALVRVEADDARIVVPDLHARRVVE